MKGDHPKNLTHLQRRRDQGLTYRDLGREFGISHTHAKKLLDAQKEAKDSAED